MISANEAERFYCEVFLGHYSWMDTEAFEGCEYNKVGCAEFLRKMADAFEEHVTD